MIEIQNLTKTFGALCAVRDLSLHVPAGEVFCFLGPNGAGKTTTIKILTGLMKPTSGSARVAGFDILSQPLEAKKRIGYIPDMPYLYERLTSREFFEFVGDLYDIPRSRVQSEMTTAFDLFDLQEQRDMIIKDLSHGMRQRLIYCATFLHEPSVLFVDEPLTGLDPYTIRMLKNLLIKKARAGMTVFLTTHILALAEDIADRIGIILQGQVEALGTTEELVKLTGGKNLEDAFLRLTAKHEKRAAFIDGDLR
jgi:ABC-2 type transport system ATP-binding protein